MSCCGGFKFEAGEEQVVRAFEDNEVEPDIISKSPPQLLQMKYGREEVKLGNVLTPTQVSQEPSVDWKAERDGLYLLAMCDPDEFDRTEHSLRSFCHWMVGNIPGGDVEKGDVLAAFIGSGPPKDSGLHRYVFLVYKQPGKLSFEEKRLHRTAPLKDRAPFSIHAFARKYQLGDPVAGNFYQAEWDESVPALLATLEQD